MSIEIGGLDVKLPAFSIGSEHTPCYMTAIDAKLLFDNSIIHRVDSSDGNGYQRFLNEKRGRDIAEYLESGNVIPGAIVVSCRDGDYINFDTETNILHINTTSQNDLLIIDGQHRLYGAHLAQSDIPIIYPICIFKELSLEQEVQYFLDINSTQRGVPKSLQIELMKFLAEPDSIDAIQHRLINDLSENESSPLYKRISRVSSIAGKISHVPFEKSIKPLLNEEPLKNLAYEDKLNLISNFLTSTSSVLVSEFGNDIKLVNAVFFQALFSNFKEITNQTIQIHKNYKIESFIDILRPLGNINFEQHDGSNLQAIKKLTDEISSLISVNALKNNVKNDLF